MYVDCKCLLYRVRVFFMILQFRVKYIIIYIIGCLL